MTLARAIARAGLSRNTSFCDGARAGARVYGIKMFQANYMIICCRVRAWVLTNKLAEEDSSIPREHRKAGVLCVGAEEGRERG